MIPIRYNLRSLMVRRTTSAMTAIVVALVVMLLFILSGFVAGLKQTVMRNAVLDNWIVLSRGTTSEPDSYISRDQYEIIKSRPQIVTDAKGAPLISPEISTGFNPNPDAPRLASMSTMLRGLYPIAYQVHRELKIVDGRWPQHGAAEMAIGRKLAARYPNLGVGNTYRFGRRDFKIVGIFSDNDSARESEVFTDLDVLAQEVHFNSGFESLHVVLKPGMESAFQDSLNTDARVRLDAVSEQEFYARETGFVEQLRSLGLIVAMILAIGAVFGAMNTMYAAVARRTSEIGVLRALGFNRINVLVSFISESVLLGLAGGIAGEILGVVVAFATGLTGELLNVGSFIFRFQLTPGAFISGMLAGIIIGAVGGLLPAWRASRIGVIESLRAV
ncbi:MAG TPA: FtsX-like permease family protein [Candidatus Binataceae bacterium]|nr:FtsX-like permease family protein [Candidatus Binataceae bacterium]